jgi:hypothetical protein
MPRAHGWTLRQRWFIAVTVLVALIALAVVVYSYERYYRGPSDSALFGTWQCISGCEYPLYYTFGPDHNIRVSDDDASGVVTRGRWYAGGNFIFLRFTEPPLPIKRAILIYHIVDLTPDELRVRIWRDDEVRSYRRVTPIATSASNQAMQRTATRCATTFP